jgi:hypothetical protein
LAECGGVESYAAVAGVYGCSADKYLGSNATIEGAINIYGLDALIMPTSQAPGIAAIAGYSVVTVPLGYHPSTTFC